MPRPKLQRPIYRLVSIPGREQLYISWTEEGRRRIRSTGTSDGEQAERERQRFEADRLKPQPNATVGELIDHWLDARKHLQSHVKLKSFAKEAKRVFGSLYPAQVQHSVPPYL